MKLLQAIPFLAVACVPLACPEGGRSTLARISSMAGKTLAMTLVATAVS